MERKDFLKWSGICFLGLSLFSWLDRMTVSEAGAELATTTATGQKRWALAIDVKKCWAAQEKGCRDCVLACHQGHNVPQLPDAKEEVKWIWLEPLGKVFPEEIMEFGGWKKRERAVPVLCNHCENPPCVRVCPTQATFKSKDGLVVVDYHRCIGCRYCMAACPFGARSFNFQDPRPFLPSVNPDYPIRERGVVEKCNFCAERLAVDALPLCVEACRAGALAFGDLNEPASSVRKLLEEGLVLRRRAELGTGPKVFYVL